MIQVVHSLLPSRVAFVDAPDFLRSRTRGAVATQAIAITKSSDRCGGDACIRDSRIPVWVVINYSRLGGSDADFLRDYPSLNEADLDVAWSYYASRAEEIERAIRENEEGEDAE